MKYRDILGFSKSKKKVVKEQSKFKKKSVLDGIKQELNEWSHQPPSEKRWSKSLGGGGLTEYEKQINEVGAAPQYKKMYKDIIKAENQLAKSVDKMASFLNKQGLKNQSMMLKGNYIQDVRDFVDKFLKGFIKELL